MAKVLAMLATMAAWLFAAVTGISAKVVVITPELAQSMLDDYWYNRQRDIRKVLVGSIVTKIREGCFRPGSVICLALVDKTYTILDGYHRLLAIIETGISMPMVVVTYRCKTQAQVHKLYTTFDTETSKRSLVDMFVALFGHCAEEKCPKKKIAKLISAVATMASYYSQSVARVGTGMHTHLACTRKLMPAFLNYMKVVENVNDVRQDSLFNKGILSVALATMEWQPKLASSFWHNVALGKAAYVGDASLAVHNLIRRIEGNAKRNGFGQRVGTEVYTPQDQLRAVAYCWNKWVEHTPVAEDITTEVLSMKEMRRMRLPMPSGPSICISGTPFELDREDPEFAKALKPYSIGGDRVGIVISGAKVSQTNHIPKGMRKERKTKKAA